MPSMAGFTPFRKARSCIFRVMAPSVLAMTARSPIRHKRLISWMLSGRTSGPKRLIGPPLTYSMGVHVADQEMQRCLIAPHGTSPTDSSIRKLDIKQRLPGAINLSLADGHAE